MIVADKFQTGYDEPLLFKHFNDNPTFKKWLSDTVFNMTYNKEGKPLEDKSHAEVLPYLDV